MTYVYPECHRDDPFGLMPDFRARNFERSSRVVGRGNKKPAKNKKPPDVAGWLAGDHYARVLTAGF